MTRCLQLAQLGAGWVAPNPMVGALLLHDDVIIGEGYHLQYGQPHAEVNCLNSVAPGQRHLIPQSKLYVSLEPCAHFGKTPPCADMIVREQIPEVIIACRDSFEKVNGHGIEKLQQAGIRVTEGVLKNEALELNRRFFTYHEKKRPYIFLKWAQTQDGFIAKPGFEKLSISNDFTNRLMHRLRASEAAILVGTHTALYDDPSLTTRYWPGKNPLRIVIDKQLSLPTTAKILNGDAPTIILNFLKEERKGNLHFSQRNEKDNLPDVLMKRLYDKGINSIIVEGGAALLQSFIDQGLWDEAIVISSKTGRIGQGIAAPHFPQAEMMDSQNIFSDEIILYKNLEEEIQANGIL